MSKNCAICGDSLDTDDELTKTYCIGHTPIDIVREALKPYGATLTDDGFIAKNGPSQIQVVVKGKRLRFQGGAHLMASGPIAAATVERFVESFWFWKKV